MTKLLLSTLCGLFAFIATANSAVIVTVKGVTWSIDTVYAQNGYEGISSTLQAQPWWGSSDDAGQFASALAGSLNSPNLLLGSQLEPLFAWGAGSFLVNAAARDFNGTILNPFSFVLVSDPAHYAFAAPASVPGVPDTDSPLILIGLAITGLAALRRTALRG